LASVWPMSQSAVTPAPTPPPTTSTSTSTGTSNPVPSPTSTPTTVPQPISVVEQGTIRSGYALITPDSGSSLPTPTVPFGIVNSGSVQAQAGISPIPMMTDGALYVDVVPGIGRNLGVAIVNAGNTTNVVTLTLRGPGGNPVGAPASLTLAPHQQVARFVTELF